MSDIGEMVAQLIAAGCAPDVAASVVAKAYVAGAGSAGFRVDKPDPAAERRREWDRERKRLQRGLRLSDGDWYPLVAKIIERDGHKCTYCGSTEKLTADHVVPLTRGGTNEESNLTACCIPCNTKKSNKLVSEWLPEASTVFHPDVHLNPPDAKSASLSIKDTIERNRGAKNRGTRLPPDFQPDRDFAKQLGWSNSQIDSEIENFRDYWIAKPGSGGCKLDWPATWRKWVRSSKVKPAGIAATAMPSFSTPADIDWRNVLTFYKKSGIWSKWAGPDPDSLACKAPPELLREFGLLKSA